MSPVEKWKAWGKSYKVEGVWALEWQWSRALSPENSFSSVLEIDLRLLQHVRQEEFIYFWVIVKHIPGEDPLDSVSWKSLIKSIMCSPSLIQFLPDWPLSASHLTTQLYMAMFLWLCSSPCAVFACLMFSGSHLLDLLENGERKEKWKGEREGHTWQKKK